MDLHGGRDCHRRNRQDPVQPPEGRSDFEVEFLIEAKVLHHQGRVTEALGPNAASLRLSEKVQINQHVRKALPAGMLPAERLLEDIFLEARGLPESLLALRQSRRG